MKIVGPRVTRGTNEEFHSSSQMNPWPMPIPEEFPILPTDLPQRSTLDLAGFYRNPEEPYNRSNDFLVDRYLRYAQDQGSWVAMPVNDDHEYGILIAAGYFLPYKKLIVPTVGLVFELYMFTVGMHRVGKAVDQLQGKDPPPATTVMPRT